MTKGERGTHELFGIFRVLRPKITGKFIIIFGFLQLGISMFSYEITDVLYFIEKARTIKLF